VRLNLFIGNVAFEHYPHFVRIIMLKCVKLIIHYTPKE